GALSRMADLAKDGTLWAQCPLLAHTAGQVGDPQVRHRATIGGAVAHGDPASDPPNALLALDAVFVAQGPAGEREIEASSFFTSGDASMEAAARAAESAPEGTSPVTDTNASAEYRGELAKVLVRRALEEALSR